MDKTIDYRNVYIHFTKPLPDGGGEQTDDVNLASEVSVFTQVHYLDDKGEEQSDFDIIDEKEFYINKLGLEQAKEKAQQYADKLVKKYKLDEFIWY
jgi:hypothetical protein